MLLFLFRHGEAVPHAGSDADRQLTESGHADNVLVVAKLDEKLEESQASIEQILCSPFKRAQQTAQSVLEKYSDAEVQATKILTPENPAQQVLDYVDSAVADAASVMLVGHNPLLSKLASLLIDGREDSEIHLGTSNILCLEVDVLAPACAKLKYWINPRS